MFDTIKCEYELPLPENLAECSGIDWKEVEFQTKAFGGGWGGALDSYSIEEDGQLYLNKVIRAITEEGLTETPDGVERQDYTGELEFYTLILKEEKDYWVEFKVIYYKGDLKEIALTEWKPQENRERKTQAEKFSKMVKYWKEKEKKWWFKFYKIYLFFVKGIFSVVRWTGESIIRVAIWIERRVT